MLWFVAITAVATAAIALFNWQLVSVTHDMKQATIDAAKASRDSAEAAKESAEAAERSLHIDRPFVLTESVEMKNLYAGCKRVGATFVLRNWGKSPAFITEVCARFAIIGLDLPTPVPVGAEEVVVSLGERTKYRRFPWTLDQGTALRIADDILQPGQASQQPYSVMLSHPEMDEDVDEDGLPIGRSIGTLTPETFERIAEHENLSTELEVALRGIVHYRDVSQKSYWTEFYWHYSVGGRGIDVGRFYLTYYKDSEQRPEKAKSPK